MASTSPASAVTFLIGGASLQRGGSALTVQDPEAIGLRGIAVDDLDRRPRPLPDPDAGHAREPDRPARALDGHARERRGDTRAVRAVGAQDLGEDGDGVVALE